MLIQKRKESFCLFNKEFKPGLLCNGTYCIAIKCKLFSENYNYYEGDMIYVCGDKNLITRNCFCKNITDKYPVRVCIYTDDGYKDIGWGLPNKISQDGRYVVNIGAVIQEQFSNFEYPEYPGEIKLTGNWTLFDGWIYESTLEARYAKFFKLLNIPFIQQPPPLPSINGDWWRIDFIIWPCDPVKKCFIEIKPGRPYEEEEMKCETAAVYVSPHPVILLYGEMCPPFVNDQTKDRPRGVSGIRWVYRKRIKRDHVVFKYVNKEVRIEPRRNTVDVSWSHPHLIKMYMEANNQKDMYIL
tara:strand:+ start:3611 stop:4504 length:894 start_codon:yes stop_codon:yes gene_type:complete